MKESSEISPSVSFIVDVSEASHLISKLQSLSSEDRLLSSDLLSGVGKVTILFFIFLFF